MSDRQYELPLPESMNGYADQWGGEDAPHAPAVNRKEHYYDYAPAPVGAPYVRDSATSKEAARRIVPHLPDLQSRVYAALQERPDTTDGLEVRLGLPHQTVSPRVIELTRKKLIRRTIRTALTRSQRRAFVYEVVEVKP